MNKYLFWSYVLFIAVMLGINLPIVLSEIFGVDYKSIASFVILEMFFVFVLMMLGALLVLRAKNNDEKIRSQVLVKILFIAFLYLIFSGLIYGYSIIGLLIGSFTYMFLGIGVLWTANINKK